MQRTLCVAFLAAITPSPHSRRGSTAAMRAPSKQGREEPRRALEEGGKERARRVAARGDLPAFFQMGAKVIGQFLRDLFIKDRCRYLEVQKKASDIHVRRSYEGPSIVDADRL